LSHKDRSLRTKCAGQGSALLRNGRHLDIQWQVTDPQQQGVFTKTWTYRVLTPSPQTWEVRRTDAEFAALRQHLAIAYPQVLLPQCPSEKAAPDRKCQVYMRFLRGLNDPSLSVVKTDILLLEFLTSQKFGQSVQAEAAGPKAVKELVTNDGEV
jgi:hypothetical protein